MEFEELERQFKDELDATQLSWVFEWITEISFFAKNLNGQFTLCNSSALSVFGFKTKSNFIGKNDYDIAVDEIASRYREVDKRVIETKKPVLNIIEPVPNQEGKLTWYSTSKVPLFGWEGQVIGVAVILRDLTQVGAMLGPYEKLTDVVDYIFKNYHKSIKVEVLAELAQLSLRQLERQFKKLFDVTPLRYIHQHRIHMACLKLRQTDEDIRDIAKEVGFYDHAHFNRIFKSFKKVSPSVYRKELFN